MFFLKLKSVKITWKRLYQAVSRQPGSGLWLFSTICIMTVLQNLGIQAFHGLKFFAKNRKNRLKPRNEIHVRF